MGQAKARREHAEKNGQPWPPQTWTPEERARRAARSPQAALERPGHAIAAAEKHRKEAVDEVGKCIDALKVAREGNDAEAIKAAEVALKLAKRRQDKALRAYGIVVEDAGRAEDAGRRFVARDPERAMIEAGAEFIRDKIGETTH